MNWFDCFDEFVISLFERFCHVTTRLAGLDSVFWERLSIAYYFAACDDLPPSEAFKFWKTVQASLQTVENMG